MERNLRVDDYTYRYTTSFSHEHINVVALVLMEFMLDYTPGSYKIIAQ